MYGVGCKEMCRCGNGASCDHIGGGCTCTEGWQGKHCDKPCPQGFYGLECQGVCNCGNNGAECNHVTGECKCSAGWTGEDCSKSCPLGTYGEECQHQCHCGNGGTCDPVSGACVCAAGWRGNHCQEGEAKRKCHCIVVFASKIEVLREGIWHWYLLDRKLFSLQ